MDELTTEINSNKIDIAVVVESWLKSDMPSATFSIPGYQTIRRDREAKRGGGICVYIRNDTPYKYWIDLQQNDIECVWITVFPKVMPRDVPNITIGAIYHPPQADHREMNQYITSSLDQIKSKHPQTGIALVGDFNQLPEWTITKHFKLQQVVKEPTRGANILDKCFTNLQTYYEKPTLSPHLGKSDHHAFIWSPQKQISYEKGHVSTKSTRVSGKNERAMFVNDIRNTSWEPLYKLTNCDEMFAFFQCKIDELINKHFPLKTVT